MANITKLLMFGLLVLAPAIGWAGPITGRFSYPNTSLPLANGTVTLTLNQAAIVAGSFNVVPMTVSCYTGTDGYIVGLPNPKLAPLATAANTFGGTLAGTYYVKITYYGSGVETVASPVISVLVTGPNNSIVIQPPVLQPANATGYKIYMGTTLGSESLQATIASWTSSIRLTAVIGAALPASNNSVCNVQFNDTMIPYGTTYRVNATSSTGAQVAGFPQSWYLGGSTIDITNLYPISPSSLQTRFPTPVLQNPPTNAPQSVNSPVNLNGYSLTAGSLILPNNDTPPACQTGRSVIWTDTSGALRFCQNGGASIELGLWSRTGTNVFPTTSTNSVSIGKTTQTNAALLSVSGGSIFEATAVQGADGGATQYSFAYMGNSFAYNSGGVSGVIHANTAGTYTGTLVGGKFVAYTLDGSSITPSATVVNTTSGGFIGVYGRTTSYTAGSIPTAASVMGQGMLNVGPAVVANSYSLQATPGANSGAGSITNAVGLQIENITYGTNNWAIRSEGGQSYHLGRMLLGLASTDVTATALVGLGTIGTADLTANAATLTMGTPVGVAYSAITTARTGSGTVRPLAFFVSAAEAMRLETTGRFLIGLTSSDVASGSLITGGAISIVSAATNANGLALAALAGNYSAITSFATGSGTIRPMIFFMGATEAARIEPTTQRMLIGLPSSDVSGNVLVTHGNGISLATATTNASTLSLGIVGGSYTAITTAATGSGTVLPLKFFRGATEQMRLLTSGTDRTCIYINGSLRLLIITAGAVVDGGACP